MPVDPHHVFSPRGTSPTIAPDNVFPFFPDASFRSEGSLSHAFPIFFPKWHMISQFGKWCLSKWWWDFNLSGAGDRNRTGDPVITSDVLYQLSYTSSGPGGGRCCSCAGHGAPRGKDGATPQNRTGDTVIFSHVLYQLS